MAEESQIPACRQVGFAPYLGFLGLRMTGGRTVGKQGYVYMMTNKTKRVLYTGVTSDLVKRIYEHKNGFVDGFTKKYCAHKLVYYESHDEIMDAITREKQIKGWIRRKKIDLIESINPTWKDLYEEFSGT